jgi:cell shape-determining protein MreC
VKYWSRKNKILLWFTVSIILLLLILFDKSSATWEHICFIIGLIISFPYFIYNAYYYFVKKVK